MAIFFYYQSFLGLVVKWKVQNGGLVFKNLKHIFKSNFVYILIIWVEGIKKLFTFQKCGIIFAYFKNYNQKNKNYLICSEA